MFFEFDYELASEFPGSRGASARITDEGLELMDAGGTTRIAWQMIERVEPGPEVWVFYVNARPILLPSWALIGDPGKFILKKVARKSG